MLNRPAYLDYQATTPLDAAVLARMMPHLSGGFGNPHSDNVYGTEAAEAIETARHEVAALVGAHAREIVFTSGATEANNILIAGAARAARRQNRPGVVTVATEHKSVLAIVDALGREGAEVQTLPVRSDGLVDLERLSKAITDRTGVVSVMAANNEIGVLQPLEAIGALCRARGAMFHTDAAQAAGKVHLDVDRCAIDLMSLSAHKVYGPMGVGAAYVRRIGRVRPDPVTWGGGQEGGLRPGTLPTPLCVGMGAAFALAAEQLAEEGDRLRGLRDQFLRQLEAAEIEFVLNGALEPRLPGNLNLSFRDVDAEALLIALRPHVAAASGSACTTSALEPSYVVTALGFGVERAESAVRFGFGRQTTTEQISAAAHAVAQAVRGLQRVSYAPAYAIRA